MSLLMDALNKAGIKSQEYDADNSSDDEDASDGNSIESFEVENISTSWLSDPITDPSEPELSQDGPVPIQFPFLHSRERKKFKNKFFLVAGVLMTFLASGVMYYRYVAESLQNNIDVAVAPMKNQQQRLSAQAETMSPEVSYVEEVEEITDLPEKLASEVVAVETRIVEQASVPVSEQSTSIKISHQLEENSIYQLLGLAYKYYRAGNYADSLSYYTRVLEIEDINRDALLGLAAISIRNAQPEKARDTYIRLLENNPQDSVALSGFLSMQDNVDRGESEARIKLLLDNKPDSPHLLFTLGSLYASQQRWAEAQMGFFKAYSADNQNADFAYNLAVSLDQLEQRNAALQYYRVAMDLVEQQPVTFKVSDVMQRINLLQEVFGG